MKKNLFCLLAITVLPTLLRADWESPPPPAAKPPARAQYAAPRTAAASRPAAPSSAPVRGEATRALYGEGSGYASYPPGRYDFGPRYGVMSPEVFSQTLDADEHPLSFASLTFVPESQFGDYGKSSTLEFESALRLFAFEEFLAGYLEGFARARLYSFLSSADISALPDVAAHLAFELAVSWRFVNRWSLELRAAPGMYSDISAPDFNCPATINLHYAFSPTLAGVAGVTLRSGWDLPVMPQIGLAWEPADFFRIEAMLPRSRVMLAPFEVLTLFAALEWRNFDFELDDKPGMPEAITINEWTASAGLSIKVTDHSRLVLEGGTFLVRELKAKVAENSTLDLSKEPFFRLGWQGTF